MFIHRRAWVQAQERSGLHPAALSDEGLRALLQAAYQASLQPEEGRYPSFRIFVSQSETDRENPCLIPLGDLSVHPKILHRVCHIVQVRTHALKVVERNGQLMCTGIIALRHHDRRLGAPPESSGPPMVGMMIRVDGPGDIRVSEMGVFCTLRGGEARVFQHPFDSVPPVQSWTQELLDVLWQKCLDAGAQDPQSASDSSNYILGIEHLMMMVPEILGRVLFSVMRQKHGGAFAVVPTDANLRELIHINYQTAGCDLGVHISDYYVMAERMLQPRSSKASTDFQHAWMDFESGAKTLAQKREQLYSAVYAISSLANTDGCVVLNRDLQVRGFGGEIQIDQDDVDQVRIVRHHPAPQAELRPEALGGTRHRSAFRLCALLPGTLCFVISQDGSLSVLFGRDGKQVDYWKGMGVQPGLDEPR